MNLQENIRRILREENKKSGLLRAIEEDGLFQVMQDTGLSLPQIYTKTGELPREVFERYIKDYIDENGYEFEGRKNISPSIQISNLVWIDYIYTSNDGNKLFLNISEFKNGNLEDSTDQYITSLDNIDDEEVFNIVDHMTQIDPLQLNESEEKKPKLLSTIEEDGLFQMMQDTGLSLKQIKSKIGELPREMYERYIKDFIKQEGYPGWINGSVHLIFTVEIQKNIQIDQFYMEGDKVTVEISGYNDYGKQTDGYIESLSNLSDDEIFTIVEDMITWFTSSKM